MYSAFIFVCIDDVLGTDLRIAVLADQGYIVLGRGGQ